MSQAPRVKLVWEKSKQISYRTLKSENHHIVDATITSSRDVKAQLVEHFFKCDSIYDPQIAGKVCVGEL